MDETLLKLDNLRNLGPKSVAWLRAVGVETLEDLEELGAVEVYRRVRAAGLPATLNLVWSVQATLLGLDWRELPEEEKARLRGQLGR